MSQVDPQLQRVPESGYSRTAHGIRNQNETTDMTHEKTYSKLNKKVNGCDNGLPGSLCNTLYCVRLILKLKILKLATVEQHMESRTGM